MCSAAERLEADGISASVVDVRSLVPLDTQTILGEVATTGRLITVEENPRLCGWGAEISSIVAEEMYGRTVAIVSVDAAGFAALAGAREIKVDDDGTVTRIG